MRTSLKHALFTASDYLNGAMIPIDGGFWTKF